MMFSIIEHIEYLIMRHDCVAIPGWGAFIANNSTAHYDDERQVLERPRRSLSFNASVDHNDGLLAQSLMRREGMSFDAAMRFIADSVTTFRQQLDMDCEVSVGRLGYFRRNSGRNLEFVPFFRDNGNDQFYGLSDLDIKTVEALELDHEEQESVIDQPVVAAVAPGRNLFSRKAVQVAASISVLLGLGVLLSTPMIVDRNHHEMATMAPEVSSPRSQQLGPTVQNGVKPESIEMVNANPSIARVGNTSGKYYMVIATLRNQQELDAFKNKYPSLVPYMKMLDYKGMMCVYVARSDDYGQLMSLRGELPERLRDVWIYN